MKREFRKKKCFAGAEHFIFQMEFSNELAKEMQND